MRFQVLTAAYEGIVNQPELCKLWFIATCFKNRSCQRRAIIFMAKYDEIENGDHLRSNLSEK